MKSRTIITTKTGEVFYGPWSRADVEPDENMGLLEAYGTDIEQGGPGLIIFRYDQWGVAAGVVRGSRVGHAYVPKDNVASIRTEVK